MAENQFELREKLIAKLQKRNSSKHLGEGGGK